MGRKGKVRYERATNEWLTTFNDLMTLLLTFFVLLITMSSLEGGKIRTMVSELSASMGVLGSPKHSEMPIFTPIMRVFLYGKKYKEVQHLYRAEDQEIETETNHITKPIDESAQKGKPVEREGADEAGNGAADFVGENGEQQKRDNSVKSQTKEEQKSIPQLEDKALQKDVEGLDVDTRGLTVRTDAEKNLILGLPERVLFETGKADIRSAGVPTLKSVARLIAKNANYTVLVLGHTDDQPIHTAQYPSNWELSVARASTVLRLLVKESGAEPSRFMASGYGPSMPVADNDTPEHRSLNRRVEIKLIGKKQDGGFNGE